MAEWFLYDDTCFFTVFGELVARQVFRDCSKKTRSNSQVVNDTRFSLPFLRKFFDCCSLLLVCSIFFNIRCLIKNICSECFPFLLVSLARARIFVEVFQKKRLELFIAIQRSAHPDDG